MRLVQKLQVCPTPIVSRIKGWRSIWQGRLMRLIFDNSIAFFLQVFVWHGKIFICKISTIRTQSNQSTYAPCMESKQPTRMLPEQRQPSCAKTTCHIGWLVIDGSSVLLNMPSVIDIEGGFAQYAFNTLNGDEDRWETFIAEWDDLTHRLCRQAKRVGFSMDAVDQLLSDMLALRPIQP